MEPRISIITIACGDLDRAVAFYEGMGLKRHQGITDGVAFFQMGGAILGLFPRKSAEADAGVAFAGPPVNTGYPRWYGYFADVDGNVWEVAHNPAFPIAEDGTISLPA